MTERSLEPRAPLGARGALPLALALVLASAAPGALAQESAAPPDPGKVKIEDAAGSVSGSLQGQEGVRIQTMCTHCNSANIQVGGLSQDLVPLTFGGFPLFGGLATSFVMNMLPSDSISEAQVARGPGEARAPAAAAGGTIALSAATPRELPWLNLDAVGGSFGRRGATLRGAGPLTAWASGALTIGREQADVVDSDGDGWTDVAASKRKIADGRLILTPSRAHRIEAGWSWIDEDDTSSRGAFDSSVWIQNWFTTGDPSKPFWTREDATFTRNEYRLGWDWRLPGAGTITLKLLRGVRHQHVISQDTADTNQVTSRFYERYRIKEVDEWGTLRYSQPLGLSWRVAGGIESTHESVTALAFVFDSLNGQRLEQDATDYVKTWSQFAEVDYTPDAHWDVLAGVRHDKDQNFGSATSPRLTVKYHPAPGWTMRLLAGKTFRPPKPIFSEVCCGRRYLTNDEAGVRSETTTTYGLEGLYQPSPDFKLSVYAAQSNFDDHLLQLVTFSQVYRQIYANANIPSARSKTLEFAGRWSATRWLRLDASIGWLDFRNTGDELVAVRYRPFVGNSILTVNLPVDRIPYRPSRSGSLGATLNLPREVSLSLSGSYTGPQLVQQWTRITSPMELGLGLLDEMRPIGGFWMVNLGGTVPLSRWLELSAGLDNLTDKVQFDLGDPTRDYNWGPLAGRTVRVNLRVHLDR